MTSPLHRAWRSSRRRRGVLLLVVLSMLTLFMLLGVTYLVLAARTRATSRAFLKLADDTSSAVAAQPLVREAALQVIRGTTNTRSAIRYHDLLADKYGWSSSGFQWQTATFVANNQLVRIELAGSVSQIEWLAGLVITFTGGLDDRSQTSVRIADAMNVYKVGAAQPTPVIWVPRPAGMTKLPTPGTTTITIGQREFDGLGFGSRGAGPRQTALNDAALMPNRTLAFNPNYFDAPFDPMTNPGGTNSALTATSANEDYDAVDEQNMALARPDGSAQSFVRPELIDLWVRDYYRRREALGDTPNSGALQADAEAELRQAVIYGKDRATPSNGPFGNLPPTQQAQVVALHALRRASLRPFAFDHYQDDQKTTDFAGRSLASLASALKPTTNVGGVANPLYIPLGDVDNDGDGINESVWLDLGQGVKTLADGTRVKPLFAIHCIDLGGRLSLNAHGSPVHAAESSVLGNPAFAPVRKENQNTGAITLAPPTKLRGGLGYGPADIRLDALDPGTEAAVFFGLASPSAQDNSIQRDSGPLVGRYGDGIGNAGAPSLPGVPGLNERRQSNATVWGDRGVPLSNRAAPKQGVANDANNPPGLFAGGPSDMWGRLAVGVDHRGHPFYANRTSSWDVYETTDNPYELDLYRARQGLPYVQATPTGPALVSAPAYVDQPFTGAELEAILRPYDVDSAASTPPRLLLMAMQAKGIGGIDALRYAATTDTWDTPALVGRSQFSSLINKDYHDPDLYAGLKSDLNRPFGDTLDNDGDGVVDEPGESNDARANNLPPDAYDGIFISATAAGATAASPTCRILTRGEPPAAMPPQPGADEPHLRARQIYAFQLYSLAKDLKTRFAPAGGAALRLFAVKTDSDQNKPPVAVDSLLNSGTNGSFGKQDTANTLALAQWAVNVVDFMDPDAIMTPFRYDTGTGTQKVVWGCEQPDVMITETLAFHDRRTADTKGDVTGETTTDFITQYTTAYNNWKAGNGPQPSPGNPDANGNDTDDGDFDQVRIPEGSLFLELHGLRNPNNPNLPRELYSWDSTSGSAYLDLGRVPAGPNSVDPVWRLSISDPRTKTSGTNHVFQQIATNPDTTPLTSGTIRDRIADTITIDRYVWLSATQPAASGTGATLDNTYYRRDQTLPPPKLKPGGYLVVGPRQTTALGSLDSSTVATGQKWGVPAQQQIVLDASGGMPVQVLDLKGNPNPGVAAGSVTGAQFGNPVPPASLPETAATWVSMAPPDSWGQTNLTIGLNVSEPIRSGYYPQPGVTNPANGIKDAYGPLDSENHQSFRPVPLDQSMGPLANELLSGGSYANFRTVFVERLADPTRPYEPDATQPTWNPYVVVDFMPIDLTVFNGESTAADPSETQGPDRNPAVGPLPLKSASNPGIDPANVPLPVDTVTKLQRRHVYFHSRQRGFGSDLPNYDNDRTLFGVGSATIDRNGHPFKPVGSLTDLQDTPTVKSGAATTIQPGGRATTPRPAAGLAANEKACFLHELGQTPAGRTGSGWNSVPYHSLGWVNSSFGRRLDVADGIPAAYAGVPDRPFPWLAWNDRPFANIGELAFVPMTPPGRLLSDYRNLDVASRYPSGTANPAPYNSDDMYGACGPGAHLLPLTTITDVPTTGSTRSRNADLLCRLYDFVRVRSPFLGAETQILAAATTPAGFDPASGMLDGRSDRLVGPFNRPSAYREPGRVNINTLPPDPPNARGLKLRERIWSGLCGDETNTVEPKFQALLNSATTNLNFAPGSTSGPTGTLVRPFRTTMAPSITNFTAAGRQYPAAPVFPQSWLTNPPYSDPSSAAWYATASGSSVMPGPADSFTPRAATLLRDGPLDPATGINDPLFPSPTPDAWANDPGRNAWFRFETLVRAQANATVRSEVYAIWVTMGLFEVKADDTQVLDPSPAPINESVPLYPDGYRLVREYGSDTGEITRHRGFYIFDRSVPVYYQTGNDQNVNDAILIERFIE